MMSNTCGPPANGSTPSAMPTSLSNRSTYISSSNKRYIFTWNDVNNVRRVDQGTEILPFVDPGSGTTIGETLVTSYTTRGPVPLDFGVGTNDQVNQIVRWIRGQDQTGMRSRQAAVDLNNDGVYDGTKTWRLGDVIHSTPIHGLTAFGSLPYGLSRQHLCPFREPLQKPRVMSSISAATTAWCTPSTGDSTDGPNKRFCRSSNCGSESTAPELGAELWAYVPYNLTPHLKCLTEPTYSHKYYVDLQPRIFDAQIFANDSTHPYGWGTIMIVGMGFGGAKVLPGDLDLNQDTVKDFQTTTVFLLPLT
ncbi:MAG: hypothetical protein MZV70_61440 [Desulfobacterales bacterium]|nr:hypothetical protein [Desulfobacterales bacterium]